MQTKILVKHTRIEINNYEIGDNPRLEYIFSVWDPLRHTSFPKCIEYDEQHKKLILPRGLDIPWLENQFGCTAMVDKKCDQYVNEEPLPIKYLPKDEKQKEILNFIFGNDKYYYTKSKSQLSINSSTGSGKTYLAVASICISGSRVAIITSSINWLDQWRDRILEYTKLDKKDIYMIAGAGSIDKLNGRKNYNNYRIFLVSHSTIKSYGDKNGWDKVEELFYNLNIGMKVYDEAHLYFDNMAKIDFHSNTRKTLYLTATPQRSNKDEDSIYQLYFKNIPSIDLFDQDKDPHVNYIAMHFNSHPSPMDIQKCKNAYGFDRIGYTNYIVNRPNFQMILYILIDMILSCPGKVLIYIGVNSAINKVYDMIIEQFPFLESNVGIYTSLTKTNKYEQLYKKIILSTTKSCGAASDIQDLMVTINLAEPFKSPVLAQQTLGRTRAYDSLYIDLVDHGFYFTKKYYEAKKPIFKQYAKSCKDVQMSDEELESRSQNVVNKYDTKTVICQRIFKG